MIEYNFRSGGFGVLIMEISMLLHTGQPLICYVPTADHPLIALKRIWNISDDRMTIRIEDRGWHPASNDMIKAFSPYYQPDVVNLFGRDYTTGRRGKTCIGLAMHAYGMGDDKIVKYSPYHKFATREIYNDIIQLCDLAGYDVVTINQPGMSVEHKSFLLNEYCDCIIGYEGGVMHLAHTLTVPSIILPWRFHGDGSIISSSEDTINRVSHSYHMDRRTYFPTTQDEICSWSPAQLKLCIDDLYELKGNNEYYYPDVYIDKENLEFYGRVIRSPFSTGELWRTRDFILQHNPDIRLY